MYFVLHLPLSFPSLCIDASVLVQAKQTVVFARLRDIVVMDVDPKTIHKKVRCIRLCVCCICAFKPVGLYIALGALITCVSIIASFTQRGSYIIEESCMLFCLVNTTGVCYTVF